ncbi:MAG: lysine--tRNA ligase, partial [Planctomycetes bacterium]|nr:lysine--tRNA ligase [Planctomycetota bacterium]
MSSNEYRDVRLGKAAQLAEAGVKPYAVRTPARKSIADQLTAFALIEDVHNAGKSPEELAENPARLEEACVAGRVLGSRTMGKKAAFVDLWDESGRVQLYLNQKELGEEGWLISENLDLGDFIWAGGAMQRTRTGEASVFVSKLEFLTKALAVPPLEKTGGLKDVETRYRKRYASLLGSPDTREDFRKRALIMRELRNFLDERGFMEVETPMMHPILGGARARPFITHHNALKRDFYLRIAPELYLKRLLVGGYEKVFEVNRNFRNEGIDVTHNPEFTMLELYEAYSDYHGIMDLTEAMIVHLTRVVMGKGEGESLQHQWGETEIDLTPPFRREGYGELFQEYVGIAVTDEAAVREKASKLPKAQEILKLSHWKIVDELFDEYVQDKLINPTFVIDYPTIISPLAKSMDGNPDLCERFELFINGMEFANAFSELNDPVEQRARFEDQAAKAAAGDEEAAAVIDEDYVRALEYGLPPTGGLG